MNREILLQSLEDFMQETDARLTSLEAKPQVPEPAVDWKAFAAKATDENRRLTAEVERLTAQRNALSDQLDNLRNVNAGLRKENARLRAALEAVEWIGNPPYCPWCYASQNSRHSDGCQHQAALR